MNFHQAILEQKKLLEQALNFQNHQNYIHINLSVQNSHFHWWIGMQISFHQETKPDEYFLLHHLQGSLRYTH